MSSSPASPGDASDRDSESSPSPAEGAPELRGMDDELLEQLARQLHHGTPSEREAARQMLHDKTKNLVCGYIKRLRNHKYRTELSTSWLANRVEKSYLSYIAKDKWEEHPPDSRKLRTILKTVASRIIIRELRPLTMRPDVFELDLNLGQVADPKELSETNLDIDDFVENLKEIVREHGPCAISVLVAAIENRSQAETREELKLSRGQYYRILEKVRRSALEFFLDQNWPGSRAVLRLSDKGRSAEEIATSLEKDIGWVKDILSFIQRYTGSDDGEGDAT